jgi:copper(I)-binding protein
VLINFNGCVMLKKILLLVLLSIVYSSLAIAKVTVEEPYVREMPPGQPVTAAFMRLHNSGVEAVQLVAVSSDSAERVEIHAHRHNNGMMRMEKIDSVSLPAGSNFIFQPGDHHLMLINLKRSLTVGDSVRLKLEFNHAEPLIIDVPVQNVMQEHDHH